MKERQVTTSKKAPPFTTAERFHFGMFSIAEAKSLAGISQNKIYLDIKRGLLTTHKRGGSTFIAGPELAKYLALNIGVAE